MGVMEELKKSERKAYDFDEEENNENSRSEFFTKDESKTNEHASNL